MAKAGSSVCERESECCRSGITDSNADHTGSFDAARALATLTGEPGRFDNDIDNIFSRICFFMYIFFAPKSL